MLRNWHITLHTKSGSCWMLDGSRCRLISRQLIVGQSPSLAFGAPPAHETGYQSGDWIGSVEAGGACNCFVLTVNPHCQGTHTESVGHLTRQRESVLGTGVSLAPFLAQLATVRAIPGSSSTDTYTPKLRPLDWILPAAELQGIVLHPEATGLILRTQAKLSPEPPFFSHEAMSWIVEQGIEHLLVELPSVDRADDDGLLSNHRLFWKMPPLAQEVAADTRSNCTITELLDLPADLPDGLYGVLVQLPPLSGDALPSSIYLIPAEVVSGEDA